MNYKAKSRMLTSRLVNRWSAGMAVGAFFSSFSIRADYVVPEMWRSESGVSMKESPASFELGSSDEIRFSLKAPTFEKTGADSGSFKLSSLPLRQRKSAQQRVILTGQESPSPAFSLGLSAVRPTPEISNPVGYLVPTDLTSNDVLAPLRNSLEFGQHVVLAPGPFLLGQVVFPYYSSVQATEANPANLVFRLYSVGAGGLPSSLLYQSSPQTVNEGVVQVTIGYDSKPVPRDLIFTIQFSGLSSKDSAGLLLPNADPTIGSTPGQMVVNNGGVWSLSNIDGVSKPAVSIAITAATVPEPGTSVLAGVGMGLLLLAGWMRPSR